MKICVLIKQVPDQNSPLTISEDNKSLIESNITWVTNESDNYALEEGLQIKELHGGEVVICTLGKEPANQILKDALAKGADRGIFLSDAQFDNLDILSIAKIFCSVLKEEKFDLILSGLQSDDQGNSQLGLLLAELLQMSHASLVMGTEIIDSKTIKVKRELEDGWFQWTALDLPASISIQSGINTPRYATLKGIMMVKNKPITQISSNNTEIEEIVQRVTQQNIYIPEKSKETVMLDGSSDEIVEKLIDVFQNDIKVMN